MAEKLRGATYVAAYLGVTSGSLHNWCKDPPPGFPGADFETLGLEDAVTARSWWPSNLPELRVWYATWRRFTDEEARTYWSAVDTNLSQGRKKSVGCDVHPGQTVLDIIIPE